MAPGEEYRLSFDIRVRSAADWTHGRMAGYTTLEKGREVIYLKNLPFATMQQVMRHEITHVYQHIHHPWHFRWATSNLAPFSSIGRFRLELEAHAVHSFYSSPWLGAAATVWANPLQWGTDILYATGLAYLGYRAVKR